MNRKTNDGMLVTVIISVTVALTALTLIVTTPGGDIARLLFTLPLVLFLPGYAITIALFPDQTLGLVERLLFAFGLSIAVVILSGLILHWLPGPLQPSSWATMLGGITITASLFGLLRRSRNSEQEKVSEPSPRNMNGILMQAPIFALAVLLVGGSFFINRAGAIPQRTIGFTQLWMVPANPTAQNTVRLGLRNYESQATQYTLRVVAGDSDVESWSMITLEPAEKWEATLTLPSARLEAKTVEALLYRLDDPETVYRRVTLKRNE